MQLTNISIRRPLFMLMVISGLLVVGFVSWTKLGVDLLPPLDLQIVVVTTIYPGASPEAVDTLITQEIENAVATMNDIDHIDSTSTEGTSSVVINFTDRAAKDSANEVERRINAIRGALPTEVRPPMILKADPSAMPIMQLTLSGSRDPAGLQQWAEQKLQKRLQATSGVAQVSLIGGRVREIQIRVDQERLAAQGLTIENVSRALSTDNLNLPAGTLTQGKRDWTIRLDARTRTPQDLNDVLVASTTSGPIYVRDVATVLDTYKTDASYQRTNGNPALGVQIVKQSTARTVDTADNIKKTLAQLQAELPADVSLTIVEDNSIQTRESLNDVQTELIQAVVLTGLVLLVFLHSLRSTLIILLAIPTSLIATLGVMYFLGLSLNQMSLMGLMLTVGILVDDSIVVLENIFRHLRLGEGPHEAAINGRAEIGFAAIAITLVDVVVFAPIAFMSGIFGQYFRQFGLVVVSATLFSLFVSFTLTPMLASRWLAPLSAAERGLERGAPGGPISGRASRNPLTRFGRVWDAGFDRLAAGYGRLLHRAIGRWARWAVVGLGLLSFIGGILLVTSGALSNEFIPEADAGRFLVGLETPPGTTLEVTDAAARTVEQRIMTLPEVKQVITTVGISSGNVGGRFAGLDVQLIGRKERGRPVREVLAQALTLAHDIPDVRVTEGSNSFAGAAVRIGIQGDDPVVLAALAAQVADTVRKVPGTRDVGDGGATGAPEMVLAIDRQQAADLGLTPGSVAGVLRSGMSGSLASTYRPKGSVGWDIQVILDPLARTRLDQVAEMPILTPRGGTVRLGQIASLTTDTGPTRIERHDRQRTVFVTASLDGRPGGDVARDIQLGLDQLSVPPGYKVAQGGSSEAQNDAFGQIATALALSVLLMYMLMVALFESLLYPLMIMFSLPLALAGAFGLLALTGNTLNMLSLIGMILLTGLVGKNAILLVDYTNTLRKRGLARNDALQQAGPTRLRPILMTTAALVLAMLPAAFKLGEGSEWRAPMAVTVIGGLLTSTLLTLVLVPAVYTIVDDFSSTIHRLVDRGSTKQTALHTQPSDV